MYDNRYRETYHFSEVKTFLRKLFSKQSYEILTVPTRELYLCPVVIILSITRILQLFFYMLIINNRKKIPTIYIKKYNLHNYRRRL